MVTSAIVFHHFSQLLHQSCNLNIITLTAATLEQSFRYVTGNQQHKISTLLLLKADKIMILIRSSAYLSRFLWQSIGNYSKVQTKSQYSKSFITPPCTINIISSNHNNPFQTNFNFTIRTPHENQSHVISFILKYYSFYSLKFLQTTYGLREIIISCLLCILK